MKQTNEQRAVTNPRTVSASPPPPPLADAFGAYKAPDYSVTVPRAGTVPGYLSPVPAVAPPPPAAP